MVTAAATITPTSVTETNNNRIVQFSVTNTSGIDGFFDFTASNGSALSGTDYLFNNQGFYLRNNQTRNIDITIVGDSVSEPSETFTINFVNRNENNASQVFASGSFEITINDDDVNRAPVANADSYVAREDTSFMVSAADGVLKNDTDADGNALTASLVSQATKGTVTLNADGSFSYVPITNANGTDTFTYRVNDGTANSNTATVTINVASVNDNPSAANDMFTVAEDATATVLNVLTNDSIAPDTGETLTVTSVTQPANGTVTLTNGVVSLTPAANFFGSTSFGYTISDGNGGTASATANVSVTAVNDAPVANTSSVSGSEDDSYQFKASDFSFTDVDDMAISGVTIFTAPSRAR